MVLNTLLVCSAVMLHYSWDEIHKIPIFIVSFPMYSACEGFSIFCCMGKIRPSKHTYQLGYEASFETEKPVSWVISHWFQILSLGFIGKMKERSNITNLWLQNLYYENDWSQESPSRLENQGKFAKSRGAQCRWILAFNGVPQFKI